MTLKDKIYGAVYGYAYGDALGLGTAFMTRNEILCYYPNGIRHFSEIIRDAHRCQWRNGDYTNNTVFLMLIADSIMECGGVDERHLAHAMLQWHEEHEDDLSMLMKIMFRADGWADDPIRVAHQEWTRRGITEASNEAMHRGVAAGLVADRKTLRDDCRRLTLLTNDDTRCVSSMTLIARMAHDLLYNDRETSYEDMEELCCDIDRRTLPFLQQAYDGELEDLELDDEDTCQYTRKCMASALWALWHKDSAADMIHSMVDAGGDSDTNAAVAGALAGLKYGYDAIPAEKLRIINRENLDAFADRIINHVEAKIS